MIIVSCNFRGLGSNYKNESIRDLINIEKASILVIQETKLEYHILEVNYKIWKKSKAKDIGFRGAS